MVHAWIMLTSNYRLFETLCSDSEYIIRKTQELPKMSQQQDPLSPYEEHVSYNVESLFTNLPIQVTICYIIDKIYV